MSMPEILAVLLTAAAGVLVIWIRKRVASALPREHKGVKLFAVLWASGDCAAMEETVKGISFLNSSGASGMKIVLADAGMDANGRKMAELLSESRPEIVLCEAAELEEKLAGL